MSLNSIDGSDHPSSYYIVGIDETDDDPSLHDIDYGPDPHHPAYLVGEVIVKPLMDISVALGGKIWTSVKVQWRSMDHALSKICNLFPGAQAASVPPSAVSAQDCRSSVGSYSESCQNTTITYHPEGACQLQTYCQTIIPSIPFQHNVIKYSPGTVLKLGNENGTLTMLRNSIPWEETDLEYLHVLQEMERQKSARSRSEDPLEVYVDRKEMLIAANQQLTKMFQQLDTIEKQLGQSKIETEYSHEFQEVKEVIWKKQSEILRRLGEGDVITLKKDGQLSIVTDVEHDEDNFFLPSRKHALMALRKLAQSTGGIMGLSQDPKNLPLLISKMLEHIKENTQPGQSIDVALVLDTTGSMSNDIAEIKKNLALFLEQAELKGSQEGKTLRFALLEYRDLNDLYLHRVTTDFTGDVSILIDNLKKVKVDGGGDSPEAVLDALLAAKEHLSWNKEAKHSIILIGDAPPHAKTVDGLHDEEFVTSQCRAMGAHIFVYPNYDLCLELLRLGDLYSAEKYIQCMPFGEERTGRIALEIINKNISQNALRKSIRYFRYIEPMSSVSFKALARIVWNAAQAGDVDTVIVALSNSKTFMAWETCVVNAAFDFKEKGKQEEYEKMRARFPDVLTDENHIFADVRYYLENDQLSKAEEIALNMTSLLSQIQAFKFILQAYKSIHDVRACERLKKLISRLDNALENEVNSTV